MQSSNSFRSRIRAQLAELRVVFYLAIPAIIVSAKSSAHSHATKLRIRHSTALGISPLTSMGFTGGMTLGALSQRLEPASAIPAVQRPETVCKPSLLNCQPRASSNAIRCFGRRNLGVFRQAGRKSMGIGLQYAEMHRGPDVANFGS